MIMLSTREVAERLGVEPRRLRQFLRSDQSTFRAVGSASRYEFTEAEVETVARRFEMWSAKSKVTPVKGGVRVTTPAPPKPKARRRRVDPILRDLAVWADEGTATPDGRVIRINLPNINDPRVRARVRADAAAANAVLETLLAARQMHVTQAGRAA
jgi:hypothetical protein